MSGFENDGSVEGDVVADAGRCPVRQVGVCDLGRISLEQVGVRAVVQCDCSSGVGRLVVARGLAGCHHVGGRA